MANDNGDKCPVPPNKPNHLKGYNYTCDSHPSLVFFTQNCPTLNYTLPSF